MFFSLQFSNIPKDSSFNTHLSKEGLAPAGLMRLATACTAGIADEEAPGHNSNQKTTIIKPDMALT